MCALRIDGGAVVSTAGAGPTAPLLVLLHGYEQSETTMADLATLLSAQFATAALRAPIPRRRDRYAWALDWDDEEGYAGAVQRAADAVLAWIDEHVDPDRLVALIGFSQGALIATQVLRSRPDRFAAVVALAGPFFQGSHPGDERLRRRRPPAFSGRGDRDHVISPERFEHGTTWLREHTGLTEKIYPGLGHRVSPDELDDVNAFLVRHLVIAPHGTQTS